jgi:hypothetical protein
MLRFPIDRGKIRVRCACGNNFIADPDDPALYRGAQFDLSTSRKKRKSEPLYRRIENLVDAVIRYIFDFLYHVQNFRLLPTRQQVRIALIVGGILAALFVAGYLFCGGNSKPPEGVV